MRFKSNKFKEAFEALNEQDQKLLKAYEETRSPSQCIERTGRECTPHTMGKKLAKLAKRCGANGIRDLFETHDASTTTDTATSEDLLRLLKEQHYKCSLSGVELTPDTASIDHIEPVTSGGNHSVDNLQWVHTTVNKMKSTVTQTEFLEFCKKITHHQGVRAKGSS